MLLTLADGTSARLWTLLGGAGAEPHNLEAGAAANQLAAGQGDIPAVELSRYAAAHGDVVVFSDVSANGALAATASRDRTARLWHRATGRPVSDPLQHDATVNCVRFSADGATLVTSTSSRKLRLWDTATGQPITDWITSTRPVARVWLSPDNRFVVTSDGEVWSVYGARETGPAWLPSLAEAVAGIRYRGDLNRISEPVPPESLAAVRQQIAGAPVPDRTNWLHSWAIQLLHDAALVGF
jgi:WD40 repeat protein